MVYCILSLRCIIYECQWLVAFTIIHALFLHNIFLNTQYRYQYVCLFIQVWLYIGIVHCSLGTKYTLK